MYVTVINMVLFVSVFQISACVSSKYRVLALCLLDFPDFSNNTKNPHFPLHSADNLYKELKKRKIETSDRQ